MDIRSEDAKVRIVPFGTVCISALIPAPRPETPDASDQLETIRPIAGTTAQTRIVSLPLFLAGGNWPVLHSPLGAVLRPTFKADDRHLIPRFLLDSPAPQPPGAAGP